MKRFLIVTALVLAMVLAFGGTALANITTEWDVQGEGTLKLDAFFGDRMYSNMYLTQDSGWNVGKNTAFSNIRFDTDWTSFGAGKMEMFSQTFGSGAGSKSWTDFTVEYSEGSIGLQRVNSNKFNINNTAEVWGVSEVVAKHYGGHERNTSHFTALTTDTYGKLTQRTEFGNFSGPYRTTADAVGEFEIEAYVLANYNHKFLLSFDLAGNDYGALNLDLFEDKFVVTEGRGLRGTFFAEANSVDQDSKAVFETSWSKLARFEGTAASDSVKPAPAGIPATVVGFETDMIGSGSEKITALNRWVQIQGGKIDGYDWMMN